MNKQYTPAASDTKVSKTNKNKLRAELAFHRAELIKNPDHIYANAGLGVLLMQNNDEAEGLSYLNRAANLALRQNDAETLFHLGNTLFTQKRPTEAIDCYRQVIQIQPDHADAHCNMGIALNESGYLKEAEVSYRHALKINPNHLETQIALGIVLRNLGRLSESTANYLQALRFSPENKWLHYNLGVTLKEQMRWNEAEKSLRRAIELDPEFDNALSHLGSTLVNLGRLEEAEAAYRLVLKINPKSELALFSLSTILLSTGKFAEGWEKFEHRHEGAKPKSQPTKSTLPQWKGQAPRPTDSILIFQEQGFGDRIQFSRYLKLLRRRFMGTISVVCHRQLTSLLRRSFPTCEFLPAAPDNQQAWQWHCPLMSLPLAFKTTIDTIPNNIPYLIPNADRVAYFGDKILQLGMPSNTTKIGIAWKTSGGMSNAASRSLQFSQFARLFSRPDTAWFSLQKEPGSDREKMRITGQLIDWSEQFEDFDDTAALIMHLDLVITIDTSIAHLAGALGRRVWLLNRYESEWRWMHNRTDSAWYPTMRLFNQKTSGDWDEVMRRVETLLSKTGKLQ